MELKNVNPQREKLLNKVLSTYKVRQFILWAIDMCSVLLSLLIISKLTTITTISEGNFTILFFIYAIFHTISYSIFNCYSSIWRYAREEEMISIVIASIVYVLPVYLISKVIGSNYSLIFYIVNSILIICFTGGLRLTYRICRRMKTRLKVNLGDTKVLIIGGGSSGEMVVNELKENPQLGKVPIGIIDDDANKIGRSIHNVKILGRTNEIDKIVKKYQVDEIILAIASISSSRKKEIIEICKETKCKLKTIPGIYEIIDGKVDIKKIRDVEIEDLLGREPIKVNLNEISEYIANKVILVTGGGGSIGSELCRQIASFNPKHLIILDNYENNAYAIQQELKRKYKNDLNLSTIIASVREDVRLEEIFKMYRPEVVFHAAAHKHVPLMEDSPSEAIKNNIFGTLNVAKLSDKYKVKRFVLISTDKAVNPTNIMGATKRAAEMIIQMMNNKSKSEFVAVRFGNVLGSNGSVIPLFKKQIEEGGPVTITHPEIIRYFMTIPEAVQLVIQAGAMAKGGEIFVLDMGEPVKIVDLAKNLITLSGLEPDVDIKIEYTGLRPGEKLYEELLMSEEGLSKTNNKKIFIGSPINIDGNKIEKHLEMLKRVVDIEAVDLIESLMREFVPTYIRPEDVNGRENIDEVAISN